MVKYTKEILESIVKESFSIAEVLNKLGKSKKGTGNYNTIKKYIEAYGLDISHFKGQTWNKGLKYSNKNALVKIEEILKDNTNFKSDVLKKRLISDGIKEFDVLPRLKSWDSQEVLRLPVLRNRVCIN